MREALFNVLTNQVIGMQLLAEAIAVGIPH
jgi:hypothetical protein